MRKKITAIFLFCACTLNTQAQNKFKIGDQVETFVAGDAKHGVVVGEYKDTDFGYGTYQVHLNGEKYCNNHQLDTRINSQYVQERFQPNSDVQLTVGNLVDVRRYDGLVYTGQILGKDENRYQVRYSRQGRDATEWFDINNTRTSAKTHNAAQPKTVNKAISANVPATASWAGQKYKVGDRVMYDDLGFLVNKSWGTVIAVDPGKRLYTIRNEKDASLKYSYAPYQVLSPTSKIDNNFFIGKWDVQIGGATSTFAQNGKTYRRFSGGMKLPPLEIRPDGTYSWTTQDNKVIRGKWKPRAGVPGIILLKALDGLDYTLYEKTEAFATTGSTRDEIGFHHLPSSTGYYQAYRIGPNKSSVLVSRTFKK